MRKNLYCLLLVYYATVVSTVAGQVDEYDYSVDCREGVSLTSAALAGEPDQKDGNTVYRSSSLPKAKCGFRRQAIKPAYEKSFIDLKDWVPYLSPNWIFKPRPGNPGVNALRVCDPGTACDGCFKYADSGGSKTCLFKIWSKESKYILFLTLCEYNQQEDCKNTCSNGQFALDFASYDPVGQFYDANVQCKSCEPGTFNSCVVDASCTWNVPRKGSNAVGENIQQIRPIPVGSCFACDQARNFRFHYYNSPDPAMNTTINLDLAIYCAGGDKPPRNCRNELYTNSRDYSECICKDQYYKSDTGECVVCPKGHYCVGGAKRQCEAHTYQDKTGQTSCKSCSSDGTAEGLYSECGVKQQREWCSEGAAEIKCVPCSQCKRKYVPGAASQVNCYRNA